MRCLLHCTGPGVRSLPAPTWLWDVRPYTACANFQPLSSCCHLCTLATPSLHSPTPTPQLKTASSQPPPPPAAPSTCVLRSAYCSLPAGYCWGVGWVSSGRMSPIDRPPPQAHTRSPSSILSMLTVYGAGASATYIYCLIRWYQELRRRGHAHFPTPLAATGGERRITNRGHTPWRYHQKLLIGIREWSLITGRGGYKTGGGGAREVLPLPKGGAEKVLAILKGGHKKFWGWFYAVAWSLSHIVGGGRVNFQLFKRGGAKSFTLSWGGGAKSFGPAIFPFCSPPLPVINDQSLISLNLRPPWPLPMSWVTTHYC